MRQCQAAGSGTVRSQVRGVGLDAVDQDGQLAAELGRGSAVTGHELCRRRADATRARMSEPDAPYRAPERGRPGISR